MDPVIPLLDTRRRWEGRGQAQGEDHAGAVGGGVGALGRKGRVARGSSKGCGNGPGLSFHCPGTEGAALREMPGLCSNLTAHRKRKPQSMNNSDCF